MPSAKVPAPTRAPLDRPRYLTVDADIKSTRKLSILITALEATGAVYVNDLGKFRGRYWIHLGIHADGVEPTAAIRGYLKLFRTLSAPARRLMKQCAVEFDIGIESSSERVPRRSGEWILPRRLIDAVARAGAQFRITVYPPSDE